MRVRRRHPHRVRRRRARLDAGDTPFAPGFTHAADGSGGIHFTVSGFPRVAYDAPLDRPLSLDLGSRGLSFDGDGDLDVAVSDESIVSVNAPPFDTNLTAMGGGGSGKALPKDVQLQFSDGVGYRTTAHNVIVGHNGPDSIHADDAASSDVQGLGGNDWIAMGRADGPYTADGGAGADTLYSQSPDTVLHGGAGADAISLVAGGTAYGDGGADSIYAANGIADVIDGGPGHDSGTWDPIDQVTSVERQLTP